MDSSRGTVVASSLITFRAFIASSTLRFNPLKHFAYATVERSNPLPRSVSSQPSAPVTGVIPAAPSRAGGTAIRWRPPSPSCPSPSGPPGPRTAIAEDRVPSGGDGRAAGAHGLRPEGLVNGGLAGDRGCSGARGERCRRRAVAEEATKVADQNAPSSRSSSRCNRRRSELSGRSARINRR